MDPQAVSIAKRVLWTKGLSSDEIADDRFSDLVDGVTRALIEQQRLFRVRLEDRLVDYEPQDVLFRQPAKEVAPSEFAPASNGISLGEAV